MKILRVGDCKYRAKRTMRCGYKTNGRWGKWNELCPFRVTQRATACQFFQQKIYPLQRMTTINANIKKSRIYSSMKDEEYFSRPLTADNLVGLEEWLGEEEQNKNE